jgi:hypothetical protein
MPDTHPKARDADDWTLVDCDTLFCRCAPEIGCKAALHAAVLGSADAIMIEWRKHLPR